MKINSLIIAGVASWAFLAGCEEVVAQVAQPKMLQVKGLYLGMPIKEAVAIGQKLCPGVPYKVEENMLEFDGMLILKSDTNGALERIEILESDKIFGSADMSPETFAQNFITSYGIPSLEAKQEYGGGLASVQGWVIWWEHRSAAGYLLRIYKSHPWMARAKDVVIERVKSAAEAQKGFN